jgi:hypothetical protein
VKGAATERWVPRLRGTLPPTVKPGTGVDGELLLRADFIPGGEPRLPAQVTGAQAAAVEPGHVTARKSLRFTDGRPVAVALVALGNRFVLDQFRDGRRSARIDVPGFTPNGGRIILFDVYAEEGVPEQLGVTIEWAAEDSARIVDHFYAAFAREFDFIN